MIAWEQRYLFPRYFVAVGIITALGVSADGPLFDPLALLGKIREMRILQSITAKAPCAMLAAAALLAGCASVPKVDRLLISPPRATPPAPSARAGANALDGAALRVLCWNIHKAKDAGLYPDLARLAAQHDLLLLQEAVLDEPLRLCSSARDFPGRWRTPSPCTG